jgi:superfamily II DNA or RNA helicase
MVGFFDSGAMADLAPGLASYLGRPTAAVRLVISPRVSPADFEALRDGSTEPRELVKARLIEVLGSTEITDDALAHHTLKCLAYLLSCKRLTVRVALAPEGLFHPKVWLLTEAANVLAAHGSSNLTGPGISGNIEQLAVDRSWGGLREKEVVDDLVQFFSSLWSGIGSANYPPVAVYDLPDAVRLEILKYAPSEPPNEADFERARRSRRAPRKRHVDAPVTQVLRVPPGIVLDSGPFAHQGEAIRAWESAGRRGILAMATGSGKTITALAAASNLSSELSRGLLVVVAAPQLPLLYMWEDEVRGFGVSPVSLAHGTGKSKLKKAETSTRRLDLGVSHIEILIATYDELVDQRFQEVVARARVPRLLIADEVHRLGRPEFLERQPEFFEYRLGLSATPERQYDPEGTEALEEFFGPQVFEFGLDKAIGLCLVPFDYFVHLVELGADELAEWRRLTTKITKLLRFSDGDDPEMEQRLQLLRIKRRRVLELAAQKLPAFDAQLAAKGPSISRTLAYATDKDPNQLVRMHDVIQSRHLTYHQVTAVETASGRLAEKLLEEFGRGQLQLLTAKRVLDEGLNVPGIRCAFVLASTTVRRQWVQRLGRVLRMDPATGKDHAEYHDFVALPAPDDGRDDDARKMITAELDRIRFFGEHARNHADGESWLSAANQITRSYFA